MTSTNRVQVSKLLVANQRFASCEPKSCQLGGVQKLSVASLKHFETKSLRVSSQRVSELHPFNLTICKTAIQPKYCKKI